ncbi:hypothetical protein [Kitasatospora albolonga]|uniref:hypothetical protein n=1 Tax=Kitasatospora albolonga TaxID=68173 RepID=UPI0035EC084C
MAETPTCSECHTHPAVVEDLDVDPARPWCLGCALVLVKLGDPILNYRLGPGGEAYEAELARGTSQTIPFG